MEEIRVIEKENFDIIWMFYAENYNPHLTVKGIGMYYRGSYHLGIRISSASGKTPPHIILMD